MGGLYKDQIRRKEKEEVAGCSRCVENCSMRRGKSINRKIYKEPLFWFI